MNISRFIAPAAIMGTSDALAATNQIDTMSIVWLCAAVAAIVFGAIFYSFVAFRHTKASTTFVPKRLQELVWALVPMAIVIAAAAPAVRDTSLAASATRDAAHESLAQAQVRSQPMEIGSQIAHR